MNVTTENGIRFIDVDEIDVYCSTGYNRFNCVIYNRFNCVIYLKNGEVIYIFETFEQVDSMLKTN